MRAEERSEAKRREERRYEKNRECIGRDENAMRRAKEEKTR